jgi:hypothetical protein
VGCDVTNGVDLAMVILEKIGNSYGTVGGQLARLFFIMFTIVYSWNHRHSPAPIIRFLNRSIGHPQVMA